MNDGARRWAHLGDQRMHRGDDALERDELGQACDDYLGASECYWLALSEAELALAERHGLQDAHVSAFRSAVPLLPHPTTPFTLRIEESAVSGYLVRPAAGPRCTETVVWPIDPPATVESSYWRVVFPILASGRACAVFAGERGRRDDESSIGSGGVGDAVASWLRRHHSVGRVVVPTPSITASRTH